MVEIFNTLINSFIDTKVGSADGFLSEDLSNSLKENLIRLYRYNAFKSAGIGDNKLVSYDQQFRGDEIYWLDRGHKDIHENKFFDLMDDFVKHLNDTCYTGITSYEFHYALYNVGTFYKKHKDQFKQKDSRKFSMIMYLNPEWVEADGGELRIHLKEGIQDISPENGKSIFFQSDELEHEVLPTHKPRMSITGWLKV